MFFREIMTGNKTWTVHSSPILSLSLKRQHPNNHNTGSFEINCHIVEVRFGISRKIVHKAVAGKKIQL